MAVDAALEDDLLGAVARIRLADDNDNSAVLVDFDLGDIHAGGFGTLERPCHVNLLEGRNQTLAHHVTSLRQWRWIAAAGRFVAPERQPWVGASAQHQLQFRDGGNRRLECLGVRWLSLAALFVLVG